MNHRIDDWALNAYADGELDAAEQSAFEKSLGDQPDAQRALDLIRRQNAALRSHYQSVLEQPVPASLLTAVNRAPTTHVRHYWLAAACAAFLAIGGVTGWFSSTAFGPAHPLDLAQQAITAHEIFTADVKHPVEIAAADKAALQTWLSKRLGSNIKVPELDNAGYHFMGGRLLSFSTVPAGQLMYEDSESRRLTIFFTANTAGGEEKLRIAQKDSLISCYWQEKNYSFAVTGQIPLDEMMGIAREIYDQVEEAA